MNTQAIIDFNVKAGLTGEPMDSFAEAAYIFEEAMEGYEQVLNADNSDGKPVKPGDKEWVTARQWALGLCNGLLDAFNNRGFELPSEVAEVDKSIDAIFFHIGKLGKMGLTAAQIDECMDVVTAANMRKLGGPKDGFGKQLKPSDWTGPEPELQAILDKREQNKPTLPTL
jgi:hypothetical protein